MGFLRVLEALAAAGVLLLIALLTLVSRAFFPAGSVNP